MKGLLFSVAAACSISASAHSALVNAGALAVSLRVADTRVVDTSKNYLLGALDGLDAGVFTAMVLHRPDRSSKFFCIPDTYNYRDLAPDFLTYMDAHPEFRSEGAAMVMGMMLTERYPCPREQ